MKLSPSLSLVFDGQCEAAFTLYARALNGTFAFMLTWGDSPKAADVPPEWGAKLYHATLNIGGVVITGGDVAPGTYQAPRGFSIALDMDDAAGADRVFQALSEGGRIDMPLQQTFWAKRFGVFVDRFGIPWTINCE
jgi:PhnB protein